MSVFDKSLFIEQTEMFLYENTLIIDTRDHKRVELLEYNLACYPVYIQCIERFTGSDLK